MLAAALLFLLLFWALLFLPFWLFFLGSIFLTLFLLSWALPILLQLCLAPLPFPPSATAFLKGLLTFIGTLIWFVSVLSYLILWYVHVRLDFSV